MKLSIFLIFILIMNGCATTYREGYRESGLASWYGPDFHGKKTANGETYDMYGRTAAHRTLPFGTRLRVTDRETGRDIEVRVNDRGPFIAGRILDLSYGAAESLGTVGRGVAEVEIEIIEMGLARGAFLVQAGSFAVFDNAHRVRELLEKYNQKVYIDPAETESGSMYRVRVGPFGSRRDAESVRRRLLQKRSELGDLDIVVIRAGQGPAR